MYLVVEWVTMSAPHSKGRQLTGGGKVLSTMRGTVLGWKAASSSSSLHSGSTKVAVMPIFFMVTEMRLKVPP